MNDISSRNYRIELDILKAIAIIAVVFYHIGWLETGYLGVDAFFVINGFLIIPSLINAINNAPWALKSYINWLLRRVMRLWPLTLIASALCLLIGLYGMLPDDFENLSASIIANIFMSQNILSALTTKDYWATANEYRPLMHFWYVGILIEFYVLLPLLLLAFKWIARIFSRPFLSVAHIGLWILLAASLIAYLLPMFSESAKFYYLPFRAFELLAGGLIGLLIANHSGSRLSAHINLVALTALLGIFIACLYLPREVSPINAVTGQSETLLLIPSNWLLLGTVILTCVYIYTQPILARPIAGLRQFAFIGKISFSIFVWHQILLAFWRYFVDDKMTCGVVICLWVATLCLSLASYYGIEKAVRTNWRNFAMCCMMMLATAIPAYMVYQRAGIIRDVPELNVTTNNARGVNFAEYCDIPRRYDKDFDPSSDKIKVLIIGNSFARDFANILFESTWAERINLSYIYSLDEQGTQYDKRLKECDFLFIFSSSNKLPEAAQKSLNPQAKMYGIGTKNFGSCNGIVYQHRNNKNYHDMSVRINPNFFQLNKQWKEAWGESSYIDLLSHVTLPDNSVRVFTDDGKIISQDCQHLTQEGARYYARIIDFESILGQASH